MLGIGDALMKLLLKGQQVPPAEAKEIGIVDEVVATPDELVARAREWIAANPELMDELSLILMRKIREETRRGVAAAGGTWTPHPADAIVDRMVLEYSRPGRSGGSGFYDYTDGKRAGLWSGLAEHFGPLRPDAVPFQDMVERMLFIEAIETVRCFDEGVLTSVPDANIGSIMGIGYPPWTGGVVQHMHGYPGGLTGFVARAKELTDRFTPPASLIEG